MFLSQTPLAAVLVVLCVVPGPCLGEDTVTIGGVKVSADCAHWQSITPAKFQGDNLAILAAARFHDGLG